MARPRGDETGLTVTTTQGHVSFYVELALKQPGAGMKVYFDNADYPSPEICRQDLVRFRNSFSALKAKDRREANRYNYDAQLDGLGCFIEKTASGWAAIIKSNHFSRRRVATLDDEPVKQLTDDYKRFYDLQMQATMERSPTCNFSEDDKAFFWEYDPETARRVFEDMGWALPQRELKEDDE